MDYEGYEDRFGGWVRRWGRVVRAARWRGKGLAGIGEADSEHGGAGSPGLRLVREGILGEVRVEEGFVTTEQVQAALVAQRVTGMRMGEALVDLGACSWDDVQRAIEVQRERRGSRT